MKSNSVFILTLGLFWFTLSLMLLVLGYEPVLANFGVSARLFSVTTIVGLGMGSALTLLASFFLAKQEPSMPVKSSF